MFDLLANLNTNRQAAEKLGISIKTIETHRSRINLKLGLHSPAELVHFAANHGLVKPVERPIDSTIAEIERHLSRIKRLEARVAQLQGQHP